MFCTAAQIYCNGLGGMLEYRYIMNRVRGVSQHMKRYDKKSVLTLGCALFVLFIAGSFTAFLMRQITDKMNRSANETLLNSTRIIKTSLNKELENDQMMLEVFSKLFSAGDVYTDSDTILEEYALSTAFFDFVYAGMDGIGINSKGEPVDTGEFLFQETALSEGKSSYTDVYVGSSGRSQVTFQVPVYRDGIQVGGLYASKTLANYNDPALFTFSGGSGLAYIVRGNDGKWVIDSTGSEEETIYGLLSQEGNPEDIQQALMKLMQDGKSGTISVRFKGQDSFLCFMPMENSHGWYLVSILPRIILQQESAEMMRMISFTMAGLLAAVISIAGLLLNRQSMKNKEKGRIYREKLFQNISSNVDFVFLLYSYTEKKVEMLSENVRLLFELEPDQVFQQPQLLFDECGMSLDDPDRQAFLEGRLRRKISKECQVGKELKLKRWVEIHLIPADAGQYLAVLRDTTAEHHMRDDLAEALKQSQDSNRATTAFFSSLSHDIRTPMNGIVGMTAIAVANIDNKEKVADCLQKIDTASGHLLALINEVLDMSRIRSGKVSMNKEPVTLPELISDLLTFIKPEVMKKHQDLQIKSAVLEYSTVISDALHLQKILLNLLSNAVKYTPDGGTISLEIRQQKRDEGWLDVQFLVEDNGIGMEPEFLDKLFTPFERAEDSRVSKAVGTGLGMAITKNIVDMMNGRIRVQSEPGMGSLFAVTIPVPVPAADQEEADFSAFKGCTVLAVDDDREACEGIRHMLEESGITAVCVPGGQQAAEAVIQANENGESFFAVILKWKMPGMDGIEAARRIRSIQGLNHPVILLAAYGWEEAEEEARKAGINGFLSTPVFKSELIHKLRSYMPGNREAEAGKEKLAVPEEHFEGVRVLLAEDNEMNREIAVELLQSSGVQVDSVENGQKAVDAVRLHGAKYYDMVFMDIHMPVMDGYTATEKLRQIADISVLPIIAMTADAFEEDIRKCEAAGMNAHIPKPIDVSKVFEIIKRYRNRREKVNEK